jgi:hypothetical protein
MASTVCYRDSFTFTFTLNRIVTYIYTFLVINLKELAEATTDMGIPPLILSHIWSVTIDGVRIG